MKSVYRILKDIFVRECEGISSVLDVGCGENSIVRFLPSSVMKTGYDINKKVLQKSKENDIHNEYVVGGVEELAQFGENSYDVVIALDVIEHVNKDIGRDMLYHMERIARKKVILTTPNGFVAQPSENPYDVHVTGWAPREFKENGYDVYGLYGLKWLRGERGAPKMGLLGEALSSLTQYVVYRVPVIAFELFAVKHKKQHDSR